MPKPVKVSVVIPAYNEAACLPECLDALARQTVRPFEVIVVDNDSSDASADVAASYPFVKVLTEPKRGRVFARNAGFRAAKGDVLARLDADAIAPANWVEWIAQYYANGNESVALTGGAHFYNMRPAGFISWAYNWLVFSFNKLLIGYPTLWGSNMALPRSLWKQVSEDVCQDNTVHEDLDLAVHIHREGGNIYYDHASKVLVEMRRIHTDRQALWPYLQMWPRTLRLHGYRSWVLCWLVGAGGLYLLSPVPLVFEKIKPLSNSSVGLTKNSKYQIPNSK
ncbi:glycosyltransferase family 2 protein [Candidatus Saccharibacteria bacterium]|nr:glycosyltransferase family 2 protein [Candidatus Saccharibacteria bacterium]